MVLQSCSEDFDSEPQSRHKSIWVLVGHVLDKQVTRKWWSSWLEKDIFPLVYVWKDYKISSVLLWISLWYHSLSLGITGWEANGKEKKLFILIFLLLCSIIGFTKWNRNSVVGHLICHRHHPCTRREHKNLLFLMRLLLVMVWTVLPPLHGDPTTIPCSSIMHPLVFKPRPHSKVWLPFKLKWNIWSNQH